MTFKKLNEDTVCCILSEDDMISYGVELEDFIMNREKVQGVLHNIVERAGEEVGFDTKSGILSLQIVPLPDKGISIMFSEKENINVVEMIEQMKSALGSLSEARKKLEGQVQNKQKEKEIEKAKGKPKDKAGEKENKDEGSLLRIYEFDSMDKVVAFCAGVSTKSKVISRLYKDQSKDTYFLMFERGKLSKKEFACVCTNAVEFGTFVSDSPVRAAHIEEHMEIIIEEKAVKVLRKYAKESK